MHNSLFSQQQFSVNPRLCFVVMPFDDTLRNVYDVVGNVIEDYCALICVRADEINKPERITDDIWRNINESRFVMADLTGRNANVFYEVGLAHAHNKPVILLTQSRDDVLFDLKGIRYLQYDSHDLGALRRNLPKFIRSCISTIPQNWNPNHRPSNWEGSYVKITSLEAPSSMPRGQQFEITLTARNNGKDANQGYFSISFPSGVEGLTIESLESGAYGRDSHNPYLNSHLEQTRRAETLIGMKGGSWGGGRWTLKYPIAEGYRYGSEPIWLSGQEYAIIVRGYAQHKGLLWFYVNASCYDEVAGKWMWDPEEPMLDIDQREENVYCGVIEVL